jgi:tyrosine-protein kinase Etk/Wzc
MENYSLEQLTNTHSFADQGNSLLRKTLSRFYENWPWFVLSLWVSVLIAVVFLRYKTPEYKISASILVKDDTKGSDFGEAIVLQGLGLTSGKSNVDNEVEVLKSRTLAESVVKDLQLYVQYYSSGKIKTTEIYTDSPFRLRFVNDPVTYPKQRFETYTITLVDNMGFTLTNQNGTCTGRFNDTITLSMGRAILSKTQFPVVAGNTYSFGISGVDEAVKKYRKSLSIAPTNKMVSMINLVLTDLLPEKGEVILSRHLDNYLKNSISDKNRIADSTITFIDQNLRLVSDELLVIEKDIERFRKINHLADLGESGRILLQSTDRTNKEQTENAVRLKIIELLQTYLRENSEQIIPASLIIEEANFTELITKYNNIQLIRGTEMVDRKSDHPIVKNLDSQLKILKGHIESSIAAKRAALQIHVAQLSGQKVAGESQIDLIPGKQRMLLDFGRQQQIKQELYIFLLKKRVETSLSRSSTIANGRIIDNARAEIFPFRPSKQLTILLALMIGLGFPAVLIYSKDLLSDKVSDRADIEQFVQAPIIAEIGRKSHTNIGVFGKNAPHYLAEQFRVLRTNLQMSLKTDGKIIMVTSGRGGEGKSFVSINLAATFALINKRVILVEFDFRKPKIAGYLNISNKGITDYLLSDDDLNQFIQPSGERGGFDVLVCGTIPHNPAELILLPKIKTMIDRLKDQYEYILFDTAPIGIVTDARLLSRYAQITLYIIRRKFTVKQQFSLINELHSNAKVPRLNVVFNDVKAVSGGDYGYYTETVETSFLKRALRRFF